MRVAVTGWGLRCALGDAPRVVAAALDQGRSGVGPAGDVRDRLVTGLGQVDVDVRPFLKRRKDRKLLPRAAVLALPAAHDALGEDRPEGVGGLLGVGREPPEEETEPALVAAHRDGHLDVERLGAEGLAAYPPLASLRTLPNLVLAHVAIQLDLTGPGGTRAGDAAAGLAAIAAGAWAVQEGRAEVVLAGGADSLVHGAQVRDAVRRGWRGPLGEAAAWVRLERPARARARGAPILGMIVEASDGVGPPAGGDVPHHRGLGRCGAADGAVALLLAMARDAAGEVRIADATGSHAAVRWAPSDEAP